jgi:opacity protein-like surface antigen
MYKIITLSLLTLSLSSALLKADNNIYSFVGAQTSLSSYENVTAPSFGIKFGKQLDTWRTAISLNYENADGNSLGSFLLQSDKGVLGNLFKKSKFQPYVGFTLGILQHKAEQSNQGYGFGINGGVTYILNHDFDLDLGYRVMTTSQLDNVDNIQNLTLSLHYFY